MREIKFRGWHEDAKDMVYFGLGENNISAYSLEDGERYSFWVKAGNPVMQFTGMVDENGVDIYEGDIVTFGDCCSDKGLQGLTETAIVEWYPDRCALMPRDFEKNHKGGRYIHFWDQIREIEVIGNIYQNPELLDG